MVEESERKALNQPASDGAREDTSSTGIGCYRGERAFHLPNEIDAQAHRAPFIEFGGLDQLPEFRVLLQGLILAYREAGSVEKILQRVAAQYAMDHYPQIVALEINPVIAQAQAMEELQCAC